MNDKQVRGKYTQEFKLEAVRLVTAGQSVRMTARRMKFTVGANATFSHLPTGN